MSIYNLQYFVFILKSISIHISLPILRFFTLKSFTVSQRLVSQENKQMSKTRRLFSMQKLLAQIILLIEKYFIDSEV